MLKYSKYFHLDLGLFGTTYPWHYIENLDKCLPGAEKDIIKRVKETNKGNIGRGRVFLRLCLNEKSLGEYLRALIWNTSLTE